MTSSYPDLQGEYCSSSQIKLSKKDYQQLLSELSSDSTITKNGQVIGSSEFTKSLNGKDVKKIIHNLTRQIKTQENHYLYIGFYDDKETIFVNICIV